MKTRKIAPYIILTFYIKFIHYLLDKQILKNMKEIDFTPIFWCTLAIICCVVALCVQNVYVHSNAVPFASAIVGIFIANALSEGDKLKGADVTIPIVICTLFIASIVIVFVFFELVGHDKLAERKMWIDIGLLILIPFLGACYDGDPYAGSNY